MQGPTEEQFEELKRILRKEGTMCECVTWPSSQAWTIPTGDVTDPKLFGSPRAGGVFAIFAYTTISQCEMLGVETSKRMSSWIWEKNVAFVLHMGNDESELPEVTRNVIGSLCERTPTTVEKRIDSALQAIGRSPTGMEGWIRDLTSDRALFMAATEYGEREEPEWLLRELDSAGLISWAEDAPPPWYMLSLNGIGRLDTGSDALVSNTSFVAMWFKDEVDDSYDKSILPAVREAGYGPFRIDRVEQSDRIVAEVREARFLVCDFTYRNLRYETADSGESAVAWEGVYYEVELAHGLGKSVIWTCRKDLLSPVHIDFKQYNLIEWEPGKEEAPRRRDGQLSMSDSAVQREIVDRWVAAAVDAGYPANPDYNGETQEGVGHFQLTPSNGRRCSAAVAYLGPAMRRANLSVLKECLIEALDFDKRRVTGVKVRQKGRPMTVRAGREVILEAGNVASPQVLMVSSNTNAPTIMIGEKASDMVLEDSMAGRTGQAVSEGRAA